MHSPWSIFKSGCSHPATIQHPKMLWKGLKSHSFPIDLSVRRRFNPSELQLLSPHPCYRDWITKEMSSTSCFRHLTCGVQGTDRSVRYSLKTQSEPAALVNNIHEFVFLFCLLWSWTLLFFSFCWTTTQRSFCPLVHSPRARNNQGWARLKSGAGNTGWVSPVDGRDIGLRHHWLRPRCASAES